MSNIASEHQEQSALIRWADSIPALRGRIYAVPNGGHRHIAVATKLKSEGVRPGYPDMGFDEPNRGYHGLRIEMKTEKGYPTDVQKDWISYLNKNGYYAVWCRGWVEASDVIRWYISMTESEPGRRPV